MFGFFIFREETAYEVRISDWGSDVCSADLALPASLTTAGSISGGVIGTAASSVSTIWVSAAMRAVFLWLPSITFHGAQRVFVCANISSIAARYSLRFDRLR